MNNVNKMRRGFTMIELIFVIVIIGILAAVAIPKLSATRDDAKISKTVANLKTLLNDAASYYTAVGEDVWTDANGTWVDVTQALNQVELARTRATAVNLKGDSIDCFTVTPVNDAQGTRLNITSTTTADPVCDGAKSLAKSSGILDASNEGTVTMGGSKVVY